MPHISRRFGEPYEDWQRRISGMREVGRISRINGDIEVRHADSSNNYIIRNRQEHMSWAFENNNLPDITNVETSATAHIWNDINNFRKKTFKLIKDDDVKKTCHFCHKKIDKRYKITTRKKRICLSCNDIYIMMKRTLKNNRGIVLTTIYNAVYGEGNES